MNDQTKAAILSVVRSLLIAVGTYAAAKGWIGAGLVEQFTGAIVAVLAGAWGAADKLKA